jgi:hypothetical protein
MANTTFSGPVRSEHGFINTGPGMMLETHNLTVASHTPTFIDK